MHGRVAFVFRTDVHASEQSPESWKGDYPAEIWSNLEQIGELARARGACAVLDGGDFFHIKAPSQNSHRLVAKVAALHQAYPCKVYCIEGNHDIKHNNLDTLSDQPLGVLYNARVFEHLRDQTFTDGDVEVRVVGVPYSPFRTVEDLRGIQKRGNEVLIAIVHALAGQDPPASVEEFYGEPVFRYGDLVTERGPDVWCWGHWHQDQGIAKVRDRWFINQGAVSRGALSKENLGRTPKVAVIEVTAAGIEITPHELQVAPAAEVFDIERKKRQDKESSDIERYVDRIRADLMTSQAASIEETIGGLDFAREVHELALSYLQQARSRKI
jgi:DNA repair exonuclease SbcCD nuclease subunit